MRKSLPKNTKRFFYLLLFWKGIKCISASVICYFSQVPSYFYAVLSFLTCSKQSLHTNTHTKRYVALKSINSCNNYITRDNIIINIYPIKISFCFFFIFSKNQSLICNTYAYLKKAQKYSLKLGVIIVNFTIFKSP